VGQKIQSLRSLLQGTRQAQSRRIETLLRRSLRRIPSAKARLVMEEV